MIRSTILLLIIGLMYYIPVPAQGYLVNQGAVIAISPGTSLLLDGNFRNESAGSMDNSGAIYLSGNWTNNATSGNLLLGSSGSVTFAGSSGQVIGGSAKTWFNVLDLQNYIVLNAETSVSGDLLLNSAYVSLGSHDLVMEPGSSITGAGPLAYVISDGAGQLVMQVGAAAKLFPVGSFGNYSPIQLANSGTLDNFGVNVFNDVLVNGLSGSTIAEIEDCVAMTWNVTEETSGGSNLIVTPYWSSDMEGSTFDRTHAGVGHYTAAAWDPQEEGPSAGSVYYSRSREGVTSLSAFAVGDLESPMAVPVVLRLEMSVFLEGPFNGSSMETTMGSDGLLPTVQPYNVAPWNYSGSESVGSAPAGMVDWILIELRDATSASAATPGAIIAQKAALLLSDGSIVDVDGSSDPEFELSVSNNLFVVLWHRNHLGVMSAVPLDKADGIYSYDFTSAASQAYLSGQKNLIGAYGMFGGDGNADDMVNESDLAEVWDLQAGSAGYMAGDFNMDSEVNNPDKDDIMIENDGVLSTVPE